MTDLVVTNGEDIATTNVTYLLYAAPGVGKTSTAKFFKGKTLVLDIDRTTRVLKGCKDIDIFYLDNVNTWSSWGDTLKTLQDTDLSQYDNIMLDNISYFLSDVSWPIWAETEIMPGFHRKKIIYKCSFTLWILFGS